MPEPAPSSESIDEALRARLAFIVSQSSRAEVARKTQTSRPNLTRYLRDARMPAAFMTQLVEKVGVNPAWLLTGDGMPFLSDVSAQTGTMAGDLLELVEAMNAVTEIRLGALAGGQHLKILRELSDALEKYEALKARMNAQSEAIFRQILDDLERALSRRELDQAEIMLKVADQVSRLCEDEVLHVRLLHARAWSHYQKDELREAIELARAVHLRSLRGKMLPDSEVMNNTANYLWGLREHGNVRNALPMSRAIVEFFDRDARNDPTFAYMQYQCGAFETETGNLLGGIALIERALPHVAPESRDECLIVLLRAQLWAGIITMRQAVSVPSAGPHRAFFLIQHALMTADPDDIECAAKSLIGSGPGQMPANHPFAMRLDFVRRAQQGDKTALIGYRDFCSTAVGDASRGTIANAVVTTLISRMLGLPTEEAFAKECADFDVANADRDLSIVFRAIHHANALHVISASTRSVIQKERRQQAAAYFKSMCAAGYRCFTKYQP
ncbi:MAG: helix-turn-helix domain-containing protein [Planctomycetes bacterium]|nr:helix-turn-helix domain-containing protein [Planctomycetota bacterium]NUQ34502.1 hypothetical protein [Planctomycetaceae bacterium]